MNRPNITKQEVEKLISSLKLVESVFIVGLRGYYKNSMGKPGVNDRGIYDDAIILIGPNYFQPFNGNTDPSRFRIGVASLVAGVHFYKKGKHNISKGPSKAYDAFRPDTLNEALPVTRDGKAGIHQGIAINIHKGSQNSTSSEGCQTIHPDQWEEFQKTAYKLMSQEAQRRIPYILIDL